MAKDLEKNASGVVLALIEKISNAIGYIYDPNGLIPANREFTSYFAKTIAQDTNLSPEEKFAINAEMNVLMKKNNNRKDIIEKTISKLDSNSKPIQISDDWMFDFWEKAGAIHNEELKNLWSNIFIHELNNPSSVSKRLLHNVSIMSHKDALDFVDFTKFCFYDTVHIDLAHPIIFIKDNEDMYNRFGITTQILHKLEQYSLIETNYDVGFAYKNKKRFLYTNCYITLEAKIIPAGYVQLTEDGQVLLSVVDKINSTKILDFIINTWYKKGVNVKIER